MKPKGSVQQLVTCALFELTHQYFMAVILKIIFYSCLCAGVHSTYQVTWLPCQFIDERVSLNETGHTDTQLIHREAMLQFDQKGDAPPNPRFVTFLVTGSELELRQYLGTANQEQFKCELRRYSTDGIYVRWPVQGANEHNRWFSCTIKHTDGLFTMTSILRHPSDEPHTGQDYRSWPVISDGGILPTSVVMVLKTESPSVKARLGVQKKLRCQFAVDHEGPNMTVEWHGQYRGERVRLFSHTSRTKHTEGSGVDLKSIAGGDASYTIASTKTSSEGSYICSVSVPPVSASVDMKFRIEKAPRVSLNVGPTLTLQEGGEQKVICEAEDYYPLDVEMVWHKQDLAVLGRREGTQLPTVLKNILHSSHKHNSDKTYGKSSFFYLTASPSDSGKQFTCIVSHQSLRVPIRQSFILNVQEPNSWSFTLAVVLIVVIVLVILYFMLPMLH